MYYYLRGKEAVPARDMGEWVRRYDILNRRVASDEIRGVTVSTVFLGINHNWFDHGPPLLFETMVFGGPHSDTCRRYATWDEAEEGHRQMCALVRGERGDNVVQMKRGNE